RDHNAPARRRGSQRDVHNQFLTGGGCNAMPTTFIDQAGATPGTALSAANLNGLVSGLTTANLDAAAGLVAGQIATVNGSSLLKGVRQQITCVQTTSAGSLNATSWASYAPTFSPALTITTTGGRIRVRLHCTYATPAGSNQAFGLRCHVNGVAYNFGESTALATFRAYLGGEITTPALPAGPYTGTLDYQ